MDYIIIIQILIITIMLPGAILKNNQLVGLGGAGLVISLAVRAFLLGDTTGAVVILIGLTALLIVFGLQKRLGSNRKSTHTKSNR